MCLKAVSVVKYQLSVPHGPCGTNSGTDSGTDSGTNSCPNSGTDSCLWNSGPCLLGTIHHLQPLPDWDFFFLYTLSSNIDFRITHMHLQDKGLIQDTDKKKTWNNLTKQSNAPTHRCVTPQSFGETRLEGRVSQFYLPKTTKKEVEATVG